MEWLGFLLNIEGGRFFYSVENFSLKVFTEKNTTVWAERWVKGGQRGKAEEVEEVGGLVVSKR